MKALALLALVVLGATAEIYFQETFSDGDEWQKRWISSKAKESEGTAGKLTLTPGQWYADPEDDKGLTTSEDARFYIYSASFPEFSNKDKTLYLQFQIKHPQTIDCGGGYLKLLPKNAFTSSEEFKPDSPYAMMFGPDICGTMTKKTHVIFGDKKDMSKNHLVSKSIRCESDEMSHLYTLVVRPDNTYEVRIDNVKVESGSLEDDFDLIPPKEILDPQASKPADWVDDPEMDDPEDKKPADWDSVPARIQDPAAKKPEDWDDETDGEWEAPTIDNPDYKGPWMPKRIPNPAYKGAWVHPKVPNPEYHPDPELYAYPSIAHVGIDVWQVKSGSVFDNILITDDEAVVAEWAKKWETRKVAEKTMKDSLATPPPEPTPEPTPEPAEEAKDEL